MSLPEEIEMLILAMVPITLQERINAFESEYKRIPKRDVLNRRLVFLTLSNHYMLIYLQSGDASIKNRIACPPGPVPTFPY